jgi:ABC-type phosphate transport system permease subunit
MVFATTLLLIFLVVVLNLAAIQIRTHLRRKYQASAF